MSRGMIPVLVMTVLLLLWLGFSIQYAIVLLTDPHPLVKTMGAALIVLPLIGLWWLALELRFVIRGERLTRRLAAEETLPGVDLPRLPSGRVDPAAGRTVFDEFRVAAEEAPGSWRAWTRLAYAYDAAGDRSRARWAMRKAIGLEIDHRRHPARSGDNLRDTP